MKSTRVAVSSGIVALLILAFLFLPLPVSRVRQKGLVQVSSDAEVKVYVKIPGILKKLHVTDGQYVPQGYVLAEFSNLEVDNELGEALTDLRIQEEEIRAANEKLFEIKDETEINKVRAAKAQAEGERSRLIARVKLYRQMRDELVLHAPRAGVVMSPPPIDEVGKQWDKERTIAFCSIGDPSRLRVLVPVATVDYRLLKEDRLVALRKHTDLDVDLRIQGLGGHTWKGKIVRMPESEAKEVPLSLTARAGGPVQAKPGPQPNTLVPQTQQFLVAIDIVDPDRSICPGALAQVKIHCRWRTAAWWTWHTISSTFDLGLM